MSQTPALLNTQWGFFISRMFILIGMLLVFTALGSFAGIGLVKLIYGLDFTNINMEQIIEMCKNEPNAIPAIKLFQTFAGSIGIFLIPALLFPMALGEKTIHFLNLKKPAPYFSWLIAIALMFAVIPAVSWLYQFNQGMRFPEAWKEFETQIKQMETQAGELTNLFLKANNMGVLLLNLVVVAVIPAICEEFFFRGALQNFIRGCFNNEVVAIVFAALIFSGFHGQFYGFLPRLFLGIILGYLYASSGNIWVAVLAHFLNNAIAIIVAYTADLYPETTILSEDYVFPVYISILSMLLVIGLITWHKKLFIDLIFQHPENSSNINTGDKTA